MSPLRVLVVDDEAPARRIMRKLLTRYCDNVFVVAEAADLPEAVRAVRAHRPNLILLDVELRGATGFTLLKQVDIGDAQVVFVTAYADFALDAFKVAATDYLVKPVAIDQLQEALTRVRSRVPQEVSGPQQTLVVPLGDQRRVLAQRHIESIEADGSYSTIGLADGEELFVVKKLGQLSRELDPHMFCRVHRSHVINLALIRSLRTGSVLLASGKEVPVSRARSADLVTAVKDLGTASF